MAELLATLSLGTDLGLDRLTDHVMRQTLVSMRLAELLGMGDAERDSLYCAGLLACEPRLAGVGQAVTLADSR